MDNILKMENYARKFEVLPGTKMLEHLVQLTLHKSLLIKIGLAVTSTTKIAN